MSAALRRLEDEIQRHEKELEWTASSIRLGNERIVRLTRNQEAIQKILNDLRDARGREVERDARNW